MTTTPKESNQPQDQKESNEWQSPKKGKGSRRGRGSGKKKKLSLKEEEKESWKGDENDNLCAEEDKNVETQILEPGKLKEGEEEEETRSNDGRGGIENEEGLKAAEQELLLDEGIKALQLEEEETPGKKSRRKKKNKSKTTPELTAVEQAMQPKSPAKPRPKITRATKRSYEDDLQYIKKVNPHHIIIKKGFVPNMNVDAQVIVNSHLYDLLLEELRDSDEHGKSGGFIPALRQVANVASLPGIVKMSIAMPDVHSGYGFCIGNVAAFDMDDDMAVVSPGGVGFDINCGVRLIRTNLTLEDVSVKVREELCQKLFDHIPVGAGTKGIIPVTHKDLDDILERGIDWAIEAGYAWSEDKEHCEERGRMMNADAKAVSARAKKRGLPQIGTLGAGNHYAEIQVVEEIYDENAAKVMGISQKNQICVMIHSGSRGFGHQVATDALTQMERAMSRDKITLNDRQLACARINSKEGQIYLKSMAAAANYAWVNRSTMTYLARQAFSKQFGKSPEELDMHLIYDVCHNIAKIETHVLEEDGKNKEYQLLVHRKGATRAFPPHHPMTPKDYQDIGQPVLVGGTMGTCSYVLVGTHHGMKETFGSTCHGAGRALSRTKSRKTLDYQEVLDNLREKGISIRVASPKLVMEEAPESYKDVMDVVQTCEMAGISKKVVKLRPIGVIKG